MKGKVVILVILIVTIVVLLITWFFLQDVIEDYGVDRRAFVETKYPLT